MDKATALTEEPETFRIKINKAKSKLNRFVLQRAACAHLTDSTFSININLLVQWQITAPIWFSLVTKKKNLNIYF